MQRSGLANRIFKNHASDLGARILLKDSGVCAAESLKDFWKSHACPWFEGGPHIKYSPVGASLVTRPDVARRLMAQPFHEDLHCVAACWDRGGWRRVAVLPLHSVHWTFAITRRGSGCVLPLHPSRMSAKLDVNIGFWLYFKSTTKNCFLFFFFYGFFFWCGPLRSGLVCMLHASMLLGFIYFWVCWIGGFYADSCWGKA